MTQPKVPRIGVFVCHCGHNIASKVRVEQVVAAANAWDDVAYAGDYPYMCSDPGQRRLRETIAEAGLDGVVVAACSPRLHEKTFRWAARRAGLNPYRVEMANIREHCAWIHSDKEKATEKAIRVVRTMVDKASLNQPLEDLSFPVTDTAVVIGGGIAGIQAALDIANGGHPVVLVEREPSVGGNMARLSETFPTLDCAQCTLTPKMVEVSQHPNIELITCAEVEAVEGYMGNFTVTIRERQRFVDWNLCTGCGACIEKCPVKNIPSEFDRGLGTRRAIFTPFPQAVPNKPTIDPNTCLWFGPPTKSGKKRCGACAKLCPTDAICFDDEGRVRTVEAGAVVVATGFRTYDSRKLPAYGAGRLPDVIDGLAFERLLSASGPTSGELLRPSDGKPIREVAFIQCAGSRDVNHAKHCSKVCCMYTSKQAMLFKHKVPDGEAIVFYIDLRHAGRDYEEFLVRTQESGVVYIRGKAHDVRYESLDPQNRGQLLVSAENTLLDSPVEAAVDLVVLATAMLPAAGVNKLASRLKIGLTADGFLSEAHLKLRPVESMTAGFYLAGAAHGPRDIPETVAQA
ncbi:MAG: CoB--CoM heterodisulfide reductase iron-sulfur subunit A family protein, partial [Proteobacteria bacterium]|nr:CoB--CoM heterodisulfide reductase iron-sulfur subunit A family protein [Pseudomonadota bacterium]